MKLKIRITANAKENKIRGIEGDELKIYINATPEKQKANKALIDFLSKEWNIPKRYFCLLSGHTTKNKLLEIDAWEDRVPISYR